VPKYEIVGNSVKSQMRSVNLHDLDIRVDDLSVVVRFFTVTRDYLTFKA